MPRGYPITERLFVGDDCPFEYVYAATTKDALTAYQEGKTVVVPTLEIAFLVMTTSGVTPKVASDRVELARRNRTQ